MRYRYNAVNFPPNPPKIHPIAPSLGRDMESILWVQTVIYTLCQSTQGCMQYHVILDRVITALDCLCYHKHIDVSVCVRQNSVIRRNYTPHE